MAANLTPFTNPASPVTPAPYTIAVPDPVLEDLQRRLAMVRWPDEAPGAAWAYGTSVDYLKSLVAYWRNGFDWRKQEAALNTFRQFTVPLHGIELHYLHEEGRGPDPLPLLLSHGWPGTVVEFQQLLPLLTDPGHHGGAPEDSFTVVAPSLPGYGFSYRPGQPRFGAEEIGDVFVSLMTKVLGYDRFGAQGGDWGAFITTSLGYRHARYLVGMHLNLLAIPRNIPPSLDGLPAAERCFYEQLDHWLREETGYQWIMGTKPQTLAFGLTDSPVGLAAWILEKFRAWSDCEGDVDAYFTRDLLLTNVMLYWVSGAINAASWPYYARRHKGWIVPAEEQVSVPCGYAEFPREIMSPPRSIAERTYSNLQRWTTMPHGGHFAALEQPEALAQEIRAFFRPLRRSRST